LITGFLPWGWSDPVTYSYGDNVYYADDYVYYGDEAVATTEEHAQQAQVIATDAPPPADDSELHFADGQTQRWLLVRLEKPEGAETQ
jgi:hypothetical protein